MTVFWSNLALERVYEIAEYLARSHPARGAAWVEKVFEAVERLEVFPNSGRIVPEIQRADVREIVYQRWRIIYKVKQHRVEVLTIRPSHQPLEPGDFIG